MKNSQHRWGEPPDAEESWGQEGREAGKKPGGCDGACRGREVHVGRHKELNQDGAGITTVC